MHFFVFSNVHIFYENTQLSLENIVTYKEQFYVKYEKALPKRRAVLTKHKQE